MIFTHLAGISDVALIVVLIVHAWSFHFSVECTTVRCIDGRPAQRRVAGVHAVSGSVESECRLFPAQWSRILFRLSGVVGCFRLSGVGV